MSDSTQTPTTGARLASEFAGTFILVFGSIGTALFAAGFPGDPGSPVNVGFLGVALAFGLSVLVSAYAFGPISGGHFNPAVTLGLAAAGRFAWRDVAGYIITQVVAGAIATSLLYVIATGREGADLGNFASNGYGEHSPGGYGLLPVILIETILTAVFLTVIIGVTSKRAAAGFAPLAIGLTLTLIHLASIPVSNTSVNPARSIATALYGGGDALAQLWVFIVFPIVGGLIAGAAFKFLFDGTKRA
ncbi:aquaporin Z [Leucobacter chromiireducens]|uniref:Aquaporin Z n=1 Tax=Leucobacter chromiireducens subsp. chromiireducens TaxID=660067 RepID=A0ABS1SQ69_9MICO|nr:aquaporin Z [Leucobacter chromiireducens]MBL3689222.1 aquaporin Z [Leucobacter chromiireducens subsp. chromiireducens]